jgi:hypothetical protein
LASIYRFIRVASGQEQEKKTMFTGAPSDIERFISTRAQPRGVQEAVLVMFLDHVNDALTFSPLATRRAPRI